MARCIVLNFAEPGFGLPNLALMRASNFSGETLIAKSISDLAVAVPAARLPCTTISPPRFAAFERLMRFATSWNWASVNPCGILSGAESLGQGFDPPGEPLSDPLEELVLENMRFDS